MPTTVMLLYTVVMSANAKSSESTTMTSILSSTIGKRLKYIV